MYGAKLTRLELRDRVSEVAEAPVFDAERISKLRREFGLSQPVFAAALNVSPDTVKKWEQGVRDPDGASRRLLEIAESHPQWILDVLQISTKPEQAPRVFKATRKKPRTD